MPETTTEGQQADFCHGLGRRHGVSLSRMLQKCCLDRRRNADVKTNDNPRGWKNHSQLTFDLNFIPHTHTRTRRRTRTHTHTYIYIHNYSLYPKLGDPIGWNIGFPSPSPVWNGWNPPLRQESVASEPLGLGMKPMVTLEHPKQNGWFRGNTILGTPHINICNHPRTTPLM